MTTGKTEPSKLTRARATVRHEVDEAFVSAGHLVHAVEQSVNQAQLDDVLLEVRSFSERIRVVLTQCFSTRDELSRYYSACNVRSPHELIGPRVRSLQDLQIEECRRLAQVRTFLSTLSASLALYEEAATEPVREPSTGQQSFEPHFHAPATVQVGSRNNQYVVQALTDMVSVIDKSEGSPAEKNQAKGLLRAFVEHPLVNTLIGASLGQLL